MIPSTLEGSFWASCMVGRTPEAFSKIRARVWDPLLTKMISYGIFTTLLGSKYQAW